MAVRERWVTVVGGGVAGLTATYVQCAYEASRFEVDDRLGRHAHAHDVPAADGRPG